MFDCFSFKNKKRALSRFYDRGFHGDEYLCDFVSLCLSQAEQFIETGTNVGSTLAYVLKKFFNMPMYSCEPDQEARSYAAAKTAKFKNVTIDSRVSPDFIYELIDKNKNLLEKNTVFWLDAHDYGYNWPLKEEIKAITENFKKAFVFIDDFKVPGLDCFKYCEYDGQVCSHDFIKRHINSEIDYLLYYPAYTDKTSKHHPLVGWGMICFGQEQPLVLPPNLIAKIKQLKFSKLNYKSDSP